jgi:hypothetical protein
MNRAFRAGQALVISCFLAIESHGVAADADYDFKGLRPASVSIQKQNGKYLFNGYVTAVRGMSKPATHSFARSEAKSYIIRAISKYLGANDQQWITLSQFRMLSMEPAPLGRLAFTAESYAELEKGPHRPMAAPSLMKAPSPDEKSSSVSAQHSTSPSSKSNDLLMALSENETRIRDTFQEFLKTERESLEGGKSPSADDIDSFAKELEALHQLIKDEIAKDIRLDDIVERPALYKLLDDQLLEVFSAFADNASAH